MWKEQAPLWQPNITEIEMTPTLERLYKPVGQRDFDAYPLQTGFEHGFANSTALRFTRDFEREKLQAYHKEKGIQIVSPRPKLLFFFERLMFIHESFMETRCQLFCVLLCSSVLI